MSKVVKTVSVVLFDESFANGYKLLRLFGPTTSSSRHIREYDAEYIIQRILDNPACRGFVPDAIYQVDVPHRAPDLLAMARTRPNRLFEGHLTKEFFDPDNMKGSRAYFAAYSKASLASTTVKRKRSAEDDLNAAKKARTPLSAEAAATCRVVNLSPVKIGIPGYADAPIYIVGDKNGDLDLSAPPSDFEQYLIPPAGRRHLFLDPTANLSQFFKSSGDNILGVYTPASSDLDAALLASTVAAYTDKSKESQYPKTFGKLAVGPAGCSSYPPSRDFVLDFDFASFAVENLTLFHFVGRLSTYIHSCVQGFIIKYDDYLHFGPAGDFLKSANWDGHAALKKLLEHIEKLSDGSHIIMIIRNYDALRNLAEVKSLTTSESPTSSSEFLSPECVTDTFKLHLYNTAFISLHEIGTISKIFLFGTSPAFSADLCPSAYTDLTTCGVVGVAGLTPDEVKVYLSVAVGDKSVIGLDSIHRAVCYILPGYVYAPDTPAQYPRRLLHTVLPALNSDKLRAAKDSEAVNRICRSVVNDLANPCMSQVVKTMYIRGKHLWKTPMDALRVRRRVPARHHARFRHRYSDFNPDLSNRTSQKKTVFVPTQPDPFFSYCLDAGYLTVRFDEDEEDFEYTFPGASAYAAFFHHIINVVDRSGLAIQEPFDGSPEWIFGAMDPYLKNSQDTLSNANAPENTFQSLRTSMMHIVEAHTGPHTYDAVMEPEMADKQRADSVVLLPQRRATIIIEDKTIRLFDLAQGITGHEFERWDTTHMVKESQLRDEDWQMAEAVATHLRKLDPSVFTEARLPDVMPDPNVPVRALDDLPTKLEDMFFVGWVDNVWGRYSIFKLWFSAEKQGQKYVSALDCRQVDDNRFHCRPCTSGEENFITVIIVIVVGAVRVLAQRSRLTTNKRCANILEHTRENPT